MMGVGLSENQLKLLQRFNPSSIIVKDTIVSSADLDFGQTTRLINLANKDTIGFFIAKFIKVQDAQQL